RLGSILNEGADVGIAHVEAELGQRRGGADERCDEQAGDATLETLGFHFLSGIVRAMGTRVPPRSTIRVRLAPGVSVLRRAAMSSALRTPEPLIWAITSPGRKPTRAKTPLPPCGLTAMPVTSPFS